MRTTEIINTPQYQLTSITCDVCKGVFTPKDVFEWQEIITLRRCGGYGSAFGDSRPWTLDLCQACAHRLFGEYVIYEDEDEV